MFKERCRLRGLVKEEEEEVEDYRKQNVRWQIG